MGLVVTYPYTVVREKRTPSSKESPMTQLRLAYSQKSRGKPSRKGSIPSSVTLPSSQLLTWKIQRLEEARPAVVAVIERLVDDMLEEIERGHL